MRKKCSACEYFRIRQFPIRIEGAVVDCGLVECEKHSIVTGFYCKQKLESLKCVEGLKHGTSNN